MSELREEIRLRFVDRLKNDLLGPEHSEEILVQDVQARKGDNPLSRYLIGILYPAGAVTAAEEDDFSGESADGDDGGGTEDRIPVYSTPRPSSIGLSFAAEGAATSLKVTFRFGLYSASEEVGADNKVRIRKWQRTQVSEPVNLKIEAGNGQHSLPGGGRAEWHCRMSGDGMTFSIFLRNANPVGNNGEEPDNPEMCLFQPEIIVEGGTENESPILNRVAYFGSGNDDPDVDTYRLLYRDKPEFAVGHGCAVEWTNTSTARANTLKTTLIPEHTVSLTEAKGGLGVAGLDMSRLFTAKNGLEVTQLLNPLIDEYREWIRQRWAEIPSLPPDLQDKAKEHVSECEAAAARMQDGLGLIASDALVFKAFQFANRAMHMQRTKSVEASEFQKCGERKYTAAPPSWRPFQIAFILLNLKSIARPESPDRDFVDLLWFPTGGGKTEAYLGLTAFTIGLRRLNHSKNPAGVWSGDGGVTVLMRYTLRLLTIQQFQRAAALICACEVLRREDPASFGRAEISIGLWVGGGATPNKIDSAGDAERGIPPGALQILQEFDPRNEPHESNPVQIRSCPWCGEPLAHTDYRVHKAFAHMQIRCPNTQCDFHGDDDPLSGVPAYLVDDDIYRRCPTLVIGTVDKFARLPWEEWTKSLFGRVDRFCTRHGFLPEGVRDNVCNEGRHRPSGAHPATNGHATVSPFRPPELIIQDELHLITGPLGSLTGAYEAAVDYLCSASGARPKIVASTATIRRFQDQIASLFDRRPDQCKQFPPPGLIAGESFFAAETKSKPGRNYVGICAPGRSMKTAAVRVLASVLHSGKLERSEVPGMEDAVDPYWTAVYYFNSLRELGGAIRLIDDDIRLRLEYLARKDESLPARNPERRHELTSRIPAKDIPKLLREMERPASSGSAMDVLLATNMISVGVDIQRFGMMVVTGQPKTSAEYIQATSRVGRQTPGLVLTLYNWSRPRDLSHYERFSTYHSMLYRHVEASSVTPGSSRARDKTVHGIIVALLRLTDPTMAANAAARNFDRNSPHLRQILTYLTERIRRNDPEEAEDAIVRINAFIDRWVEQCHRFPNDLTFAPPMFANETQARACLITAAENSSAGDLPVGTLNSLREVETTSGLYYKRFQSRSQS